MSFAARRRIVFFTLVLLSCWPALQRLLVTYWNVNPWELCGFAMYVQPNLPVEVRIRAPSGEFVDTEKLEPETQDAFRRYRERASTLGLLASPDELVSMLKRAGLSHEHVDIEVGRPVLTSAGTVVTQVRTERVTLP
ncbi:MAG: hypothetical protein IPM54_04455 [Polyangiaceae bacterium]|nr:hypothetical protein [Polyangiaceae bacterium]